MVRITRLTSALLLAGAGIVLAWTAVGNAGQQAPPTPATPTVAATTPLPANLPAGEIQSVTVKDGGTVIVIKAAQPIPVDDAAGNGMTAHIDPATRTFREGTAEDAAALAAAGRAGALRAAPALRQVAAQEQASAVDGGGYYIRVDESLMTNLVAHRAADGSVVVEHAQGHQEAEKAVTSARKPAGKGAPR
jgi:hypothetical protein